MSGVVALVVAVAVPLVGAALVVSGEVEARRRRRLELPAARRLPDMYMYTQLF